MPRPEVADAVRATCEAILHAPGVALVPVRLGSAPVGAIPLDVSVEVSEEISRTLDAGGPIPGRYTLEVAAAGIERPLVRPTDYRRVGGRTGKGRCRGP